MLLQQEETELIDEENSSDEEIEENLTGTGIRNAKHLAEVQLEKERSLLNDMASSVGVSPVQANQKKRLAPERMSLKKILL